MPNYFSASHIIFIVIVCYAPILNVYIPKTSFGAGLPDFDLVRISTILLFIAFFIEVLRSGRLYMNSWIVAILGYSIVVAASVSWAKAYVYDAQMMASFFDMLFVPMFIAVVALNVFQNTENRRKYAYHVIFAVSILSIISFYQTYFDVHQHQEVTRASSSLGNPNLLAIILVLWLPIILVSERKKWVSKKLSIIVQGILLFGVIVTVSKKGIFTWFLTYLLFYYFNKEKQKIIYLSILGAIGAVLLLAYSAAVSTRFSEAQIQHNVQGKWNMMMAGLHMFIERPFIGHGYNGYYENFGNMFRYSWKRNYDAHNEFATALANYGILGFSWFMAIFIVPLNFFYKKIKKRRFGKKGISNRKTPNENLSDQLFQVMGVSLIPPLMFSAFYAGALFKQPVAVITFFSQVAFALAVSQQVKKTKNKLKNRG